MMLVLNRLKSRRRKHVSVGEHILTQHRRSIQWMSARSLSFYLGVCHSPSSPSLPPSAASFSFTMETVFLPQLVTGGKNASSCFGCKLADGLPVCPKVTSSFAAKPGVGLNIRGKVSFIGKQSISGGCFSCHTVIYCRMRSVVFMSGFCAVAWPDLWWRWCGWCQHSPGRRSPWLGDPFCIVVHLTVIVVAFNESVSWLWNQHLLKFSFFISSLPADKCYRSVLCCSP